MAYPKKKRGFREITVNGVIYRWRVNQRNYDLRADTVTIQGPISSGQQLVYRLRSILPPTKRDDGFISKYSILTYHDFYPITPRFVRQAILYGLEHGWTPDTRINEMVVEWTENLFDE